MKYQSEKKFFLLFFANIEMIAFFSKYGFQAHALSLANVNQWSSVNNTNKF